LAKVFLVNFFRKYREIWKIAENIFVYILSMVDLNWSDDDDVERFFNDDDDQGLTLKTLQLGVTQYSPKCL